MASLVYESENCLAEEHVNIGINKGNEAFIVRSFETFLEPGNAPTDRSVKIKIRTRKISY